jgi:hypothetical protein
LNEPERWCPLQAARQTSLGKWKIRHEHHRQDGEVLRLRSGATFSGEKAPSPRFAQDDGYGKEDVRKLRS